MVAFVTDGIYTWLKRDEYNSVRVRRCSCLGFFSFNCKLDLYVLQDHLNGVAYRDNMLNTHFIANFNNHPLADKSIFKDNNARPHRTCIVSEFRQQEAIDTF
jgi:hypothetical protein